MVVGAVGGGGGGFADLKMESRSCIPVGLPCGWVGTMAAAGAGGEAREEAKRKSRGVDWVAV